MNKTFTAIATGMLFFLGLTARVSLGIASVQPADLRCESLVNPQGIDIRKPRLSWALVAEPGAGRGLSQSAYELQVASSEDQLTAGHGDLWDSGKIMSAECVNVRYTGVPLESLRACFWRVKVWDQAGEPSEWSKPATWSMGLLEQKDWGGEWIGRAETGSVAGFHGKWIWYPEGSPEISAPLGTRYFRRAFSIPAGQAVLSAKLIFTGDNEATVSINGHRAGFESDFHNLRHVDVTSQIHTGGNVIAASVANTGDGPNPAGFVAQLEITLAGVDQLQIQTDSSWKSAVSAPGGWDSPGFDDASWTPAKELGPIGMNPWGDPTANDRVLPARQLRKSFTADKPIRRAVVCYSGLGWSELYINGSKVGTEVLSPPLSDYSVRQYYVTHDVTDLVKQGANAMGVWLGNGRFFAPRLTVPAPTRTFGTPQLRLRLHLEYSDGGTSDVFSDGTWRGTTGGPILANNEYDGETYDARREISGWSTAAFDDSSWPPADVMQAPAGELSATMIDPTRVMQKIKPVSVNQVKPGVFVFDMGQNFAGWCRLKVTGPRGTAVTLRHAERRNADGTIDVLNLRSAKATDVYVLKGAGTEVYEPRFTLHGFKYVEVTGYPGTPGLDAIEGEVVYDDMEKAGDFTCSNPLLNHIYRNIVWGTQSNYRSIVTDCCQRDERQGWTGDRNEECRGESYVLHNDLLYSKWVQDMADSQRPDGLVSDVCPAYWQFYSNSVTWPGGIVMVPNVLMDQFGDTAAIERDYPNMVRWMQQMAGRIAPDNTLSNDSYGDWCTPPSNPKTPYGGFTSKLTSGPLIATCYFYHCSKMMARYARLLDKPEDVTRYEALADRMREGLNQKFFKPAAAEYDNGSQCSSALPLAFGMVPADQVRRVADRLAESIVKQTHGHIATGLIGCQWINTALARNGHADVAVLMDTQTTYPSMGYMIGRGATTIWELWNGDTASDEMNSGNHLMLVGDLCTFLYEDLAGIRPDPQHPGFQHIIMKPQPAGGLTSASGSHQCAYGIITSAWNIKNGSFHWDVTIPPNTTASLFIPAKSADDVTEAGKPATSANGLTFVAEHDGRAEFTAASGEYHLAGRPITP